SSSLSPLILSAEEMKAAITFAKTLDEQHQESMAVEQAYSLFSDDILQQLDDKYILELQEGGNTIRLKSKMLATFLSHRLAKPDDVTHGRISDQRQRVGIFVDYENISRLVPSEMNSREVGTALVKYAEQFGNVVCKWAVAEPSHLSSPADMRLGLDEAGC